MQHADTALAQPSKTGSRQKLVLWGAFVVVAHYVAVIWHVTVLVRVEPSFPRFAILALLLVNLLPAGGLIAFAKGFRKSAAALVIVPLGIALVIGGYTHFLSPGTDNVLRMPPGDLTASFRVSALLLALLEAAGCWIGVKIYSNG